ncbi:polysaccharide deacetylase family protein [Dehalobacterium formicoaceticum]|uniref:polysaccharide deacetylase family protein n=1 Tax=Dehalobacterium formicoaceticum TaxID=51515 RepID=UPI0012FAE4C6|nr:polysaccharide deacetylase family protein [Dehalobacterium formicoaceticum]
MTQRRRKLKGRKRSFPSAMIWISLILALLFVVFVYPKGHFLYANTEKPDESIPVTTVDKHHPEPDRDTEHEPDSDSDSDSDPDPGQGSEPVTDPGGDSGLETNLPETQKPEEDEKIAQNEKDQQHQETDSTTPPAPPAANPPVSQPSASPKKTPIFSGNSGAGKKVAITFDDGPVPGFTAEYLGVLNEHQVPATFFMVGTQVKKYPHLAQKIADMGFTLGSHSYQHSRLTLKSPDIIQEDFRKTEAVFASLGEVRFFRPPYGDYNDLITKTAQSFGLTSIGWNVDPRDWDSEDSTQIANHVLTHVKDGAIILLHEGKPSTLAALPKIFNGLTEMGYQVVPVADLLP